MRRPGRVHRGQEHRVDLRACPGGLGAASIWVGHRCTTTAEKHRRQPVELAYLGQPLRRGELAEHEQMPPVGEHRGVHRRGSVGGVAATRPIAGTSQKLRSDWP